ncbi:hypothetical protein BDW62DRAFT_216759 [Aspergillus aurantiobrunneus]
MADPLSISASVLAITTAAIRSTNSLCATVGRFKERNKALQDLQVELEDLSRILNSLEHAVDTDTAVLALLQGPVDRCSRLCDEFEQSMKEFSNTSKAGFRDWAKMEFRRANISEFIETIGSYKSTILLGLGIIIMQTSEVSYRVLQEYNKLVRDTSYNLNVHLRRIDKKLARLAGEKTNVLAGDINLENERAARKHESRINREPPLPQSLPQNAAEEDTVQGLFEAQQLTRQSLKESHKSLTGIIFRLQEHLANLVVNEDPKDGNERQRLQEDLNLSKQCLEVCQVASEDSTQEIFRVVEVVGDGDRDQVVVTTLADLFDIKKAHSTGISESPLAQWNEIIFSN